MTYKKIGDCLSDEYAGEQVAVRGWVHRIRKQKDNVFLTLRDPSGLVQCVLPRTEETNVLTRESSVTLSGEIHRDDRAPGGYEIHAPTASVVGPSENYPIGREEVQENPQNPYALMNRVTLEKIRDLNAHSPIKYYFVPKIHPVLDELDEIESLLREPETVAVKIHGLAAHIMPRDVSTDIVSLVNKFSLPFFVHTDYLNPDFKDDRTPSYLRELIAANTPQAWMDWAEVSGVQKVYLAHLARLDHEAIARTNASENFLIGLGPDLMLEDEPLRLCQPTTDILGDALRLVDIDTLAFSTDFAWNVPDRRYWDERDWGTNKRLVAKAKELDIPEVHVEKVLGKNAAQFFNL